MSIQDIINNLKRACGIDAHDVTEPVHFMSEEEIVADLLAKIKQAPESLKSWMEIDKSDIIKAHFSTGMAIRNSYNLWHEKNPYTDLKDANAHNFPDQMSHRIMEKIWGVLHEEA